MHPIPESHPQSAWLYSLSILLERTAYYGIRGLVLLYMVSETIAMSNEDALWLYAFFATGVVFSQVIGAMLGDLVWGARKTLIAGGGLLGLGALVLCIPGTMCLYIGMGLASLGAGLYAPNLLALFGKAYLKKERLLDAGFSMLYFAINIGAFLGALLIGLLGAVHFSYGFGLAILFALLSILPVWLQRKNEPETSAPINQMSLDKRFLVIAVGLLFISLYWGVSEIIKMDLLQMTIDISLKDLFDLPVSQTDFTVFLNVSPQVIWLLVGIFTAILWTFWYSHQSSKLMIGFVAAALAMVLFIYFPETTHYSQVVLWFSASFLLSIAEAYIAPVMLAVIVKYGNPRFLALLMSLWSICAAMVGSAAAYSLVYLEPFPKIGFQIGAYLFTPIALILIAVVVLLAKNRQSSVTKM